MNTFFKCAELGRSMGFPLKELSQNFPMDNITLNQLDRSLVKDLAKGREGRQESPENGSREGVKSPETPEAKKDKEKSPETPEAKKSREESPETPEAKKDKGGSPETPESKKNEAEAEKTRDQSGEGVESRDPEAKENRELTQDEINAKQQEAIKDAFQRILRGEKLTDKEKGNLCEMLMDQYYISQGYTPLHRNRVTSLNDAGHHGLDGVYQKGNKFVIADAKYDTSQQKNTQDGRQMSWDWIDKRLDDAVGKEKADEIRQAREDNPDNVVTQIYHFKLDAAFETNKSACGSLYNVDEDGKKDGPEIAVEIYQDGEKAEFSYESGRPADVEKYAPERA